MESVLRLEESLWFERFVNDVGLEPGVKESSSSSGSSGSSSSSSRRLVR